MPELNQTPKAIVQPTLNMRLVRDIASATDTYTCGMLYMDGVFKCCTVEDAVRETKIYGETAIPFGLYEVVITHSPKFCKRMPLLLNVVNFEGIRIHTGNTHADTHGCILVGMTINKETGYLKASKQAYDKLFALLEKAAAAGTKITIEIVPGSE